MDIERLQNYIRQSDDKEMKHQLYWEEVWSSYVEESVEHYQTLKPKEALPEMISEKNYFSRANATSCDELGVWVKVGDICFIDFGKSYLNEAGYQHFGIVMKFMNNKALVIPMTSNPKTYKDALLMQKSHLFPIGKLEGMYRHSVLFLNDARFINTARIIDVKANIPIQSTLFQQIKKKLLELLE